MAKRLYEKLNEIKRKKREVRCERLKEICIDEDILNDAIEIVKHESTINLSGAILITALSAILLNLLPDANSKTALLILYFVTLVLLVKFEFEKWTDLYYDLMELRRMRRGETDISKLDIILFKVETINQRMDNLGKIVSTKLESIEKEIISLKNK